MKIPQKVLTVTGCLIALFLGGILLPGSGSIASGEEDLSSKAEDAGKSVEQSVHHAVKKTGEYLRSDAFHQDLKRVMKKTGDAIRKGGDWVGNKLDSTSKPDAPKP